MKLNIGTPDRIVRILFAVVVALLFGAGAIESVLAVVLGLAAAILLVTGLAGICPIYFGLNLSTCKVETERVSARQK
jgi:hypothetical protein